MKTYKLSAINIPCEVAVFPLANTILFPESEVPLYIFEPRYRQMLKDSMKGNKFIAISLFKAGWEKRSAEPVPSHEVVGVGYLRAVIDNPDGTAHILLRGAGRAKILRYIQMRPYRIAKVEPLPDHIENPEELLKLFPRLRKLFLQKVRWDSDNPGVIPKLPRDMNNPITLSHLASFLLRGNPYRKQDLLETINCNNRIKYLIDLLEEEMHAYGSHN